MNHLMEKYKLCEFCGISTHQIRKYFFKCPKCKNIYNKSYQTIAYEDTYFETEYKKQYGKSYIDDKKNIQLKMQYRLNRIKPILQDFSGKKLLEIGSAAGFFLEIANENGFISKGWEISTYMSEYANQNGNTTIQGNFLDLLDHEKNDQYDVISAFYVIEHFTDQKKIWEGFQRLLKKGGLLLLAVPSYFGPAFYFHKDEWDKNHPKDHYIDYSPYGIKTVCNLFGFKKLLIYTEGLHPERFLLGNVFFLKYFYNIIQKTFNFSDTIYIVLKKSN